MTTESKEMLSIAWHGNQAFNDDQNGLSLFVSPSFDLAAKAGTQVDSWFAYAYLESSRGMIPLLTHCLHLELPESGSLLQIMYSLLDPKTNIYLNEEFSPAFDQCSLSFEKLEIKTPSALIAGDASKFAVKGEFTETSFDLTYVNEGSILPTLGNGVMPFFGDINYHYALPTMSVKGSVTINGETYEVAGPGWMDRQFGRNPRFFDTNNLFKWVWFGIMLENGDRLSIWNVHDAGHEHSFCTLLHKDGGIEVLPVTPLLPLSAEPWVSPKTGQVYPTKWDLRLPTIDGKFEFETKVKAQEIFSLNYAGNKYEGTTDISGSIRGKSVKGKVIIELVGNWK